MPKIIWVGNQFWDKEYPDEFLPDNAIEIKSSDNIFLASIPYGILPMLLVYEAMFLKKLYYGEVPFDRWFIIIGIILGLLLMPVHEWLHAICSPKDSVAYCGICVKKFAAFCVCHYPMTKTRYIIMSLLPMILGIVPLILFFVFPISWKIASAICWSAGMMGMLGPMPDYMDVHHICNQVPNGAYIQSSSKGLFWYQ